MQWKGVVISLLAAAAFYATLVAGSGSEAAVAAAARLTWPWWLAILLLSLVNYALRFARWDSYLHRAGHHLPVIRHLVVYVAGFALTTTPAKAGEAIRALYLKPFGVTLRRCIATLYVERLVDVIAMALLAVTLLVTTASAYRWLAVASAALAGLLMLVQHETSLRHAGRLVGRMPVRRLRHAAEQGIACLREAGTLLRGRMLLQGIGIGLVAWGAEALAFHLVLRELGIPIGFLGAVGIYATAMLAGALSFVPGGLGGTELVMASLLMLGGAPPPAAMAATTIIRIATLWFAVALGMLALLVTEATQRGDPAAAGTSASDSG